MIAAARVAAYDALRMVSTRQRDLPEALARVRPSLTDERDRALAVEIVTGTLRWQAAFDHVIVAAAGRPLAQLDAEVVDILRLTIFQLLHLDRVPASAAVNDAVSLTKRAAKRSAAPLVNAVLRRVSRERQRLSLPPPPPSLDADEAAVAYLSVTLSHPEWLVRRWLGRYGFEATATWARFNNAAPPLMLRANRLKTTAPELVAALAKHGVRVEPARYAADALTVLEGNPLLTPLADGGTFVVQDEASQLVAQFAAARPGERVLDACASPGGKTTAMLAGMQSRGVVVATDLRPRRVELLARTVAAAGASRAYVVRADVERPLPFRAVFDLVLLDAPCSGLGIVRRDPDIKWRRTAEELPALAQVQLRLMLQASEVVRPGGRLVYATCSSEPEENEQVVAAFLRDRGDFHASAALAAQTMPPSMLDEDGAFRTLPHRDGLEAFFAATVVKTAESR